MPPSAGMVLYCLLQTPRFSVQVTILWEVSLK